jgi:carboxyl-terminal processing protease
MKRPRRFPRRVAPKARPPDEKDDRALKKALDLLRGTITDAAFPPNPKAAIP